MNDLMNKIFTKASDLTQTSGVITNMTDNLLNCLVPQEDVSAEICQTIACTGCFGSWKLCTLLCCDWAISPCAYYFRRRPC